MFVEIDENIITFLNTLYPKNESILIGCRGGKYHSYNCCEYNIIVLLHDGNKLNSRETRRQLLQFNEKKLKLLFYDRENFIKNSDILFLDYVPLTNIYFKSNQKNYFELKKCCNNLNIKLLIKRKLFKLALDCVQINKDISNGKIEQNLSSFYVQMISFYILELMIQLYLNEIPSPSHLKYQINFIKGINSKIKETVDILLDVLEIDQSNISSIERSIKYLVFLIKTNLNNFDLDLLLDKLEYFKKKSMYVDANLLIHSFILNQAFDKSYINSYSKTLKNILNIKNKDEIFISKELQIIFNILKNLIANSY